MPDYGMRTPLLAPPVDRTTDRWHRIRSACVHAADYIDLDLHADNVCLAVEAFTQTTGPLPQFSRQSSAAAAQEEP